jgi:ribosome-binding protein aMBF1 (putative translation factor)
MKEKRVENSKLTDDRQTLQLLERFLESQLVFPYPSIPNIGSSEFANDTECTAGDVKLICTRTELYWRPLS